MSASRPSITIRKAPRLRPMQPLTLPPNWPEALAVYERERFIAISGRAFFPHLIPAYQRLAVLAVMESVKVCP